MGLSGEGEGSVWWGVLQVDVDQCPDVSGSCSIAAMPTFILFARGKEMSRVTGANPAKLRELLQQATYESGGRERERRKGVPFCSFLF